MSYGVDVPFVQNRSPHHDMCSFITGKVSRGTTLGNELCFRRATHLCGNGVLEVGEGCDDGNALGGQRRGAQAL